MKNLLKKFVLLFLVTSGVFVSCNKDEATTQTVSTDVEKLLSRISMKNTQEEDSMSDSCFDLVYPFSGTLNGVTYTFNNNDNLFAFVQLAEQNNWNLENFMIAFPFKVVFYDYTEKIIYNQAQLVELSAACDNLVTEPSINCFDFVYPINLSVYNTTNQNTTQVTMNNDQQLYTFIQNNSNNTLINLSYPISIKKSDGTVIQVNNDSQLETWAEECD